MSVGKQDAAGGEAIDVGGFGLRVSSQAPDPIIQIVHRDEKNIGPIIANKTRIAKRNGQ